MQVYRDLRVLTARPSVADEAALPHAIYGSVDGAVAHSVAGWLADVSTALADAASAGRVPILVGGTGLYLSSVLEGLSPIPDVPAAVRERWRTAGLSGPELHAALAVRDAAMAARLNPSDPQRLVRALEVVDGTGRSLSEWQRTRAAPLLTAERCARIVLEPPRSVVRARIAKRFERMLADGALAEVERLITRRLDTALPVMKAIGVRPLGEALAGARTVADAADEAVVQSRQYAKRQSTWFRNRLADWPRAGTEDEAFAAILSRLA